MAEISQKWGKEAINEYNRPYFKLEPSVVSDEKEVTLPSGASILYSLLEEDSLEPDLIEDIMIGYKLTKDTNPLNKKFVVFEPSWYYKYSGTWIRLPLNETEGLENGLE